MAQQIGPKEQLLKMFREANLETKKKKALSPTELRKRVAEIKPKGTVKKGKRGR